MSKSTLTLALVLLLIPEVITMIKYIQGATSLIACDALVNPVNCKVYGQGSPLIQKEIPGVLPNLSRDVHTEKLRPGILLYVHLDVQPPLFENQQLL